MFGDVEVYRFFEGDDRFVSSRQTRYLNARPIIARKRHETAIFHAELRVADFHPAILCWRSCRRRGINSFVHNLQPNREVTAADGRIWIVRNRFCPNPGISLTVNQQFGAEAEHEGHVQCSQQKALCAGAHRGASRRLATSLLRALSRNHPPSRNITPKPIRLSERPSLSITLEK